MLMGEKPPACAPCTTMTPISSGLILYFAAKPIAIGATIATAAGLTAPIAVSTPVIANITHGINAIRPPTSRIAMCTNQSVVPLARAMANRNVTPTSTTNSEPGKPLKMSSAFMSADERADPEGRGERERSHVDRPGRGDHEHHDQHEYRNQFGGHGEHSSVRLGPAAQWPSGSATFRPLSSSCQEVA